ncbi:hypothetical protein CPC08DRAFT_414331 [Agrocybe pediades]|nr:hypothetical protein CPC08DRAFT_414331 [Agrocybe pediades]
MATCILADGSNITLVNPTTPLAFVPADTAFKANIAADFIVVSLTIIVWDILHNLYDDYTLLFKERIRLPTVTYFVSRTGALGYAIVKIIFLTIPIKNCQAVELTGLILYAITTSSTALLFFILWLGVVGGTITIIEGVHGSHQGQTEFCINDVDHEYIVTSTIASLINDTMVFLAITYKFGKTNATTNLRKKTRGIRKYINGDSLPAFSRAMLQNSQKYYLIAVTMNAMVLIVFYAASSQRKSPVRVMFIALNNVLVSILACRVFRVQKLAGTRINNMESLIGTYNTELQLGSIAPSSKKRQTVSNFQSGTITDNLNAGDSKVPLPMPGGQIEVSRVVEWAHDYGKADSKNPSGMSLHDHGNGDV